MKKRIYGEVSSLKISIRKDEQLLSLKMRKTLSFAVEKVIISYGSI